MAFAKERGKEKKKVLIRLIGNILQELSVMGRDIVAGAGRRYLMEKKKNKRTCLGCEKESEPGVGRCVSLGETTSGQVVS